MKQKKLARTIYWIAYFFLMAGFGALGVTLGFLDSLAGIILFTAIGVALICATEWLDGKIWPKCAPAEKETKLKYVSRSALQAVMGGAFAYGLLSLIFAPLRGGSEQMFIYIGLIGLSLLCFILVVFVPAIQDRETKEALEESKYYNNDERLQQVTHKSASICFGVLLIALLLFGAWIAIFPPENFYLIPLSLLGIFFGMCLLYLILFHLYLSEKLDVSAKHNRRKSFVHFLLSLVPLTAIGIYWVVFALSPLGIVFFVSFLLVSAFCLFDFILSKHS